MVKKKTTVRRVFALMLTLIMTLALAVPAAADNESSSVTASYTITIKPNLNTLKPTSDTDPLAGRFEAYAIFTGELNTNDDGYKPGNLEEGNKTPNANQLANIKWGNGIDSDELGSLLAALKGSSVKLTDLGVTVTDTDLNAAYTNVTFDDDTTLGDVFADALSSYNNNGEWTIDGTAAVVAKVIADLNAASATTNNSELANKFAGIVSQYKADAPTGISEWDATNNYWQISGLANAGYYLIMDTYTATPEKDEISKYIVGVFGTQTIYVKSQAATLDKQIVSETETGEEALLKGDSAGISDQITFRLKGALPENYENYETFQYIFHDKLSAGLTFDGAASVKVYAEDTENSKVYLIDNSKYSVVTESSQIPAGESFVVIFEKLNDVKTGKEVTAVGEDAEDAAVDGNIAITNKWNIYVQYTATVNENAVVVDPKDTGSWEPDNRNNNSAYLEYSNDVNNEDSTAQTTHSFTYVYVYGFDIFKEDGISKKGLGGAGFSLTRTVDTDVTEYAYFSGSAAEEWVLEGWISEAELEAYLGKEIDEFDGWDSALGAADEGYAAQYADKPKNLDGKYLTVMSDSTAGDHLGKFKVKGLDEGTYTVTEQVTPPGYETMAPFDIKLIATFDTDNKGALTKLEAQATAERENLDVWITKEAVTGKTSGYVGLTIDNMPAGYLPGTGGIGTILFYVGGGMLLAAALVILIIANTKKDDESEDNA